MSDVIIYHNPRCSKSLETLALLEEQGVTPRIVLYLEDTPSAAQLKKILGQLGMTARELMRTGEQEYKAHNLKDPSLSETDLIAAMVNYPKLIQRPIVVAGNKASLGRPPEQVLDIL